MANFNEDLNFSHSPELEMFWQRMYEKFWPGMVFSLINDRDNLAQRLGVDRLIYTGVNKFITIDEKADRHRPDNFFLEFLSADSTNSAGWLEKELAADYIAYGFVNHNVCHFLPAASFCYAWRKYGEAWKKTYGVKVVSNGRYNTHGVAVPIPVVWKAIAEGLYLQGATP